MHDPLHLARVEMQLRLHSSQAAPRRDEILASVSGYAAFRMVGRADDMDNMFRHEDVHVATMLLCYCILA